MRIRIINHLSEISQVHATLKEYATGQGIDELILNKICIVIDEILTNIIKYAYVDDQQNHIDIECRVEPNRIHITFEDDGDEFNPLMYRIPDPHVSIDNKTVGGLGILLMKELTDEIDYIRSNQKNIVTVVMYLN